jgi:hypothetical protein
LNGSASPRNVRSASWSGIFLGMLRTDSALLFSLVAGLFCLPAIAFAHPAGPFDRYGCHEDKRDGTYHCHRGPYKDITFRSKSDMMKQREAGATATDAARSDPTLEATQKSLFGPLVGEQTTDQRAAGTNEVVTPKGIEKRLSVLNDLRDKGLITPDEYDQKKKEILGQL